MTTFQWLLILGFPPSVAAASAAPEILTDAERIEAGSERRGTFLPRVLGRLNAAIP